MGALFSLSYHALMPAFFASTRQGASLLQCRKGFFMFRSALLPGSVSFPFPSLSSYTYRILCDALEKRPFHAWKKQSHVPHSLSLWSSEQQYLHL